MSKTKIVFVGNEAKRTGAPIMMLHFLRWLKANTDIDGTIVLRRGGELEAEYAAIYPTHVWKRTFPQMPSKPAELLQLLWFQVRNRWVQFLLKQKLSDCKLLYANTFASADLLPALSKNCSAVLHVHELEGVLEGFLKQKAYQDFKKYVSHYVCASQATQQHLLQRLALPVEKTSICYEFITLPKTSDTTTVQALKKQLSIPENAFVVGGSGSVDWRKGADLFVQLALQICAQYPDIYFVWVGGGSTRDFHQVRYDAAKGGISDKVIFTGAKTNPADYYALSNVFVLTSREDPFPLVCLENAALAKPIICFEKAGGMPEFVSQNNGIVVPYLDVQAMSKAVIQLYHNAEQREALGENARQTVQKYHVTEYSAPQLHKTLKDIIK